MRAHPCPLARRTDSPATKLHRKLNKSSSQQGNRHLESQLRAEMDPEVANLAGKFEVLHPELACLHPQVDFLSLAQGIVELLREVPDEVENYALQRCLSPSWLRLFWNVLPQVLSRRPRPGRSVCCEIDTQTGPKTAGYFEELWGG